MAAELNDVIQLLRMRGEVERGKDLADQRAHRRKRQGLAAGVPAFLLEKRIRDGGQHHVSVPPGIRTALEVVEPEFVLELLILLLDGPPLMCDPDEAPRRGSRRQ